MNRTEQSKTRAADQRRSGVQQAGQTDQQTWKDGGREPVHPDDIGDDGEYLGKGNVKQQLRSDDN